MKKYKFKVCIIGKKGVGRTSLIKGFIKPAFSCHPSNIGIEFYNTEVKVEGNIVMLSLWDLTGLEEYYTKEKFNLFFKGAAGSVLVYDITDISSFNAIGLWIKSFREYNESDLPIVLVGNKSDLKSDRQVPIDYGKEALEKYGLVNYFETSVKFQQNVEEPFIFIVQEMIKAFKEKKLEE